MASIEAISTGLGIGVTNIMPDQRKHRPGTTVNRERAPRGMHRSLPATRTGDLDTCLVEASTASKVGTKPHVLGISKVSFLGSAMQEAGMGSMAKTIFPSTHKGVGLLATGPLGTHPCLISLRRL